MSRPRTPKVSILIPTRNAGPLLGEALSAARAQVGVGDVELVVADSASSDGTADLARGAGAQVVESDPAEFNHGRARNQLAELARGQILLFTVQDAVLQGADALLTLVEGLRREPSLAALSARQVPRDGADLYSRFHLWAHAKQLTEAGLMAGPGLPVQPTGIVNPVLAQLAGGIVDNVCAATPRALWERLRFSEVAFGEDIDYGLRARDLGKTSRFEAGAVVAHHHDRDASYHFARAAVAGRELAQLLPDAPWPEHGLGIDALAAELRGGLRVLESGLGIALGGGAAPIGEHTARVAQALRAGPADAEPGGELVALDALLGDRIVDPRAGDVVTTRLIGVLDWDVPREFGLTMADPVPASEARRFIERLLGAALGSDFVRPMLDEPGAAAGTRISARVRSQHDRVG